jgi:mannose-6-phosphate isomerase-like protein (cupin superfamily)
MKIENKIVDGYLKVLSGLELLPGPQGERYIELFRHGTLSIELYAPRDNDPQTPHARDEIYVIASGSGRFRRGSEETSFGPGDVLFVPAGKEHRFEEFTDDFATWVFFYGPEGGEPEVIKP